MADPKGWTPDRVRAHLANAVYLEMWTVPLYLTAAYSLRFDGAARPTFGPVPTTPDGEPDFARFSARDYNQYALNALLSVAVQEMLHVELAANLLNAVRATTDDVPVVFAGAAAPDFTRPPPCIDAASLPPDVKLGLGPLDANQARLFQWIEEDRPTVGDPEEWRPSWPAIGDFYKALAYGVSVCWGELYPPKGLGSAPTADELRQKDDWGSVGPALSRMPSFLRFFQPRTNPNGDDAAGGYPFSIAVSGTPDVALTRAQAALAAITAQGEGAGASTTVPPVYCPTDGDPIEIALDRASHYERFTEVLGIVREGLVSTYEGAPGGGSAPFQAALDQGFSAFLMGLEVWYGEGETTLGDRKAAMLGLGSRAFQVWQSGGQPGWKWLDPREAIDPDGVRQLHACQGLNACKGLGAGGTGDGPGLGDCATAWYHTCGSSNLCKGQAGCGYTLDPNTNTCRSTGGCGAPIPATQGFAAGLGVPEGSSVWDFARKLLREKYPSVPEAPPAPNTFRASLTPTAPKH